MSKTSAQGSFRFPFWLTCYPKSGNRHRFRLRIPRNVPLCRRPDPALAGLSPVMPCRKRVQKKKLARRTIRILPVRPPGHALPRLSFSDNSIIARQERAIKVTLGYFKILWDTFLDNMLAKVWKPVSFPSPDSPECSLVPPVPAVIPIRLWPYRHPSCPARKGCKKGSACADGSNPPGSPSRPRPPGHALPATPSRAFPFLTILS